MDGVFKILVQGARLIVEVALEGRCHHVNYIVKYVFLFVDFEQPLHLLRKYRNGGHY